ncbi:hypothetical protein QP028_13770 [Corynebacterium suedekumii]|uniref:Uncharacterized protein n=1 Tax=Corynebacterium suedekumii TaxID=3049801 RepID=A0ABY8VK50_9CORY|nr:hypothetical protein [Corynebacterium suedekumii]WIM70016.1 hypothetical protein QP029_12625 [Corynebacterium suedekumii]WIM72265.1 hypothetical protein QP028_13770 [Corynebacterium suedekumii]
MTEEQWQARRARRRADDYALLDPDREPSLQDHDVEDTGRSVRARNGGLPGTGRRRR